MDRTRAVIGADAKFAGTISNVRSIEIEGTVEADLTAEKLSIGATGKFTGQVSCDLVVIGGAYDGIMQAGSIWATETAQIAGEIHYQSLQMDRGAALNCRVVHNWQVSKRCARPTRRRADWARSIRSSLGTPA